MAAVTQVEFGQAPDWIAAEMPPGYQTRLLEIQRLSSELRTMDGIGRVLWEAGQPLSDAVCALFGVIKCDPGTTPGPAGAITVNLGGSRRLLLVVAGAVTPIEKTSEELARAFQAVQYAEAGDWVVLVVNNDPATPPQERPNPVLPEALGMLERMGVDVVTTGTLFRLWRLSCEDHQKAVKTLDRLHAQDGGAFVIPGR